MTIDENDLNEMLHDDDDGDKKCPLEDKMSIPSFMLEILKMKSGALADSMKLATDLYRTLDASVHPDTSKTSGTAVDLNAPKEKRKDEVFKFIKEIMVETKTAINQYDYLVAMIESENDDKGGKK